MLNDAEFEMKRERLFHHLALRIRDERVVEAMERVPRERFIPQEARDAAYDDNPLPIGKGQTISQPYIIALMTEALSLTGTELVLEIGTGSGYQAAILALLARKVVSVERHPELIENARGTLDDLGYDNIEIHQAKNGLGWPEEAPYDGIIVTAAAPEVPQPLIDQLDMKGRLVIPVGGRYEQTLLRITRERWGVSTENLGGCRFVPLIGEDAWTRDK